MNNTILEALEKALPYIEDELVHKEIEETISAIKIWLYGEDNNEQERIKQ